jgi:hypothetical protein
MKRFFVALALVLSVATVAFAAPKPKLAKNDAQAIALAQAPGKVESGELEKEYGAGSTPSTFRLRPGCMK